MGFVRTAALLLEQQRRKKETEAAEAEKEEAAAERKEAGADLDADAVTADPVCDEETEKAKEIVENLLEKEKQNGKTQGRSPHALTKRGHYRATQYLQGYAISVGVTASRLW